MFYKNKPQLSCLFRVSKMINIYVKIAILYLFCSSLYAQKRLPDVFIEDLQRKPTVATAVLNPDGPTLISFWATWCKPCLRELNAINAELAVWTRQTNVKFVAISADDSRTRMRVPSYVKSKNWLFANYVDANADLQRSLNILSIPHTIIVNANGEIIYQHSSYSPGDEVKYFEVLQGL